VSQMAAICSVYRYHYPVLSSFMNYHWVYNDGNSADDPSGARIVTLPEHLSSSPVLVRFVLLNL
jgi:hypothetical protein